MTSRKRYSQARYRELMDDYYRRTGERIHPPPAVLAVVPLLRRSPRQAVEPTDVAAWLLQLEDGRPLIVIEKPQDPDIPAVDVLLSHLGRYGQAHRNVVDLMIEGTRLNRIAIAKFDNLVDCYGADLRDALGGLVRDANELRGQIEVEWHKIDFLSIFTRDFRDIRERFVSLCDVSARFIRRYGTGHPASWDMDPRSIALPTAFQIGFGRDGLDGFRIPPCDRLVEKWDEWDIEYRAFEGAHPRLPLLDAIIDFRAASDQSAWPFSGRDPLLDWINGGNLDFPWPDALLKLGADFPERIRNLWAWAGGWWRYVEGRGEVFYPY
jgi:hypothetical protein